MKLKHALILVAALFALPAAPAARDGLPSATVSRLEMIANTRRLVSKTVTNNVMVCTYTQGNRTWTTTNELHAASGYVKPPVYSKFKIYVVLSRAGYWVPLREWLKTQTVDGLNAWEAFIMCNDEVSADHPLFAQWLKAAEAALGVNDATAQALLKQCEQ